MSQGLELAKYPVLVVDDESDNLDAFRFNFGRSFRLLLAGSGEEALAVLKAGSLFGEMSVFDRSERSTDAISNGGTKCLTISRSDFELLLDFNREIAYKVLWSCVRLLSGRLRSTNDSLRSFLAMSMF